MARVPPVTSATSSPVCPQLPLPPRARHGVDHRRQKQVDAIAAGRAAQAVKSLDEAKSIKGNLESSTVTVKANAGRKAACSGRPTADIAGAGQGRGRAVPGQAQDRGSDPNQDCRNAIRRSSGCTPRSRPA